MNKPVKFELAKLLKEKNWIKPTLHYYFEDGKFEENVLKDVTGMDYGSEYTVEYSELINNWNDKFVRKKNGGSCFGCENNLAYFKTYSAPVISDIVMWLYEKHDIWIKVIPIPYSDNLTHWRWEYVSTKYSTRNMKWKKEEDYMSPSETYEAAIEYCLTKLI